METKTTTTTTKQASKKAVLLAKKKQDELMDEGTDVLSEDDRMTVDDYQTRLERISNDKKRRREEEVDDPEQYSNKRSRTSIHTGKLWEGLISGYAGTAFTYIALFLSAAAFSAMQRIVNERSSPTAPESSRDLFK